jgi:hypothetical protein
MGLGLFDAFDSGSGRQAARNMDRSRRRGLSDAGDIIEREYNEAEDTIRTGYGDASDHLDTGQDYLDTGYGDATDYLETGLDQQLGFLQKGADNYQGLYDRGVEGIDLYGTLSGLNGGQAGVDAFHNTPDYLLSREAANAGLQGIARFGNSRGMLNSGNMSQDSMDYLLRHDAGILNQARGALNPYFGLAENAAGGLSNSYGRMADASQNAYNRLSGLATGYGQDSAGLQGAQAGLDTGMAGVLAGLQTGAADRRAGYEVGAGQSRADMYGDMYNADQTANNNMWNAILGLGGAAASIYGA